MNTDSAVNADEKEQLQVEETDDSSRLECYEIVPLTRGTDSSCTAECVSGDWSDEVKQENLADVNQPPDDDCESSFICSVKDDALPADMDDKLSNMRPVVVLKTLNLARLQKKYKIFMNTGESSCEVKTEADSSDHTKHSHDDKSRPYLCPVCDKRFIRKSHLNRHSKIHTQEDSQRNKASNVHGKTLTEEDTCLCTQCEKRFSSQDALRHHMLAHTDNGESSAEAKTEADSSDHTGHQHDDKPRQYLCTVCDKQFTGKRPLNVHRKTHTEEKSYPCTQCDKRFSSRVARSQHMNIHAGKYKCTECGKCCHNSSHLAVHSRSHSGEKPFECTVCGIRFTAAYNLALHARKHSGERPYKCRVCDKAFSQAGGLNSHMRIHTECKPYKCHVCDKAFRHANGLKVHLICHAEDKPYKCYLCDKTYCQSASLKTHMRVHMEDQTIHMFIV